MIHMFRLAMEVNDQGIRRNRCCITYEDSVDIKRFTCVRIDRIEG